MRLIERRSLFARVRPFWHRDTATPFASYRHRGFLKPLRLFETAYDIEKLRMKLSNSSRTFFVLDLCYVAFIQNKLGLIWIVKSLIYSIS